MPTLRLEATATFFLWKLSVSAALLAAHCIGSCDETVSMTVGTAPTPAGYSLNDLDSWTQAWAGYDLPLEPLISWDRTLVEVINQSIYDFPKYYDLVFGADCAAELKFILAVNEQFLDGKATQLFEPACGTCRLMQGVAKKGFAVEGIDLNEKAIEFGNQRFARAGFPQSAWVADMSDFAPRKKFDLAFNTINSFRHLATAEQAEAHLRCMGAGANKDAIYLIGIHLNPLDGDTVDEEAWSARRGHLAVNTHMWTEDRDPKARMDRFGIHFDVYTPTKQFRITDELAMRSYTHQQFLRMIEHEGSWGVEAAFDFRYQIKSPIEVDDSTEDVVFVLRRR